MDKAASCNGDSSGECASLASFGFDLPDEAWLDPLREVERTGELGRMGAYELLSEVGRGAQAIVYQARERGSSRIIAVKRLLAGSFATPAMRSRFEREAEATFSLRHSNIVAVFKTDSV